MMRVWSSVVLIVTCAAFVAAAQRPSRSVPIRQSVQIGAGVFEPGDTPSGGNGQPVDGIEGSSREMLAVHIHAHLSIFDHGRQIAVPYAIGFVRPFRVENGFVDAARGIYWLHTHDATGIIHVESPDPRTYTLGNFFDIWGRPLTTTNVAGIEGPVHAYVDGKPYTGNPRDIVLRAHAQITLEVGTPLVTPPTYVFPEGL
ncbi:MAG TPA: hypothetical protein VHD57_04790 [Vicinamibacterales bacterium]|jgi:hypothetical protein|nr:hypothetical protein [Vicinamibacterales bacterium]